MDARDAIKRTNVWERQGPGTTLKNNIETTTTNQQQKQQKQTIQ